MANLRYGEHKTIELDVADSTTAALLGVPRGRPVDDVSAAVARAVDEPLDYPPLRRATTPGDRVVIALAPGLPQDAQVAAVVVEKLVEAGVHPDGISVLLAEDGRRPAGADPRRMMDPAVREHIGLDVHDPDNRADLAYLAASESGRPILISRTLHDADLVLPVGGVLHTAVAGYFGIHSGIFPTFADSDTLSRFRSLGSLARSGSYKQALVDEVDEAAWLLGIHFTIQLLPADGFGVLEVLAGQCEAVRRRAHRRYEAVWRQPNHVPQTDLVVAGLAGAAGTQTWQNVGRALENAGRLVSDGGAIAVCCELADAPGPGVQCVARAESHRAGLQEIRQRRPVDALPAAQLARALDRCTVYLLSRLEPEVVEDLDMVPIGSPAELARLTRQYGKYTVLANASCALLDS